MTKAAGASSPADQLRSFSECRPRVRRRLIFSQADRDVVVQVAAALAQDELVQPVLIGDPADVRNRARSIDVSLAGVDILPAEPSRDQVQAWHARRASRGLSEPEAAAELRHPTIFAQAMVHAGFGGAAVWGPGPARELAESRALEDKSVSMVLVGGVHGAARSALAAAPLRPSVPSAVELAESAGWLAIAGEHLGSRAPEIVFLAPGVPVTLERRPRFRSAKEELELRVRDAIATLRARWEGLSVVDRMCTSLSEVPVPAGDTWQAFLLTEPAANAEITRTLGAHWGIGSVVRSPGGVRCELSEDQTADEMCLAVRLTALSVIDEGRRAS